MKGSVYANRDRVYRMEFAADLAMRAEAEEKLGDAAKAEADRKRATALAFPYGPNAAVEADELPSQYVDLLGAGDDAE